MFRVTSIKNTLPAQAVTPYSVPRREFLWRFGGGLGGVALAHLLGQHDLLAETQPRAGGIAVPAGADLNGGLHHRAKVKRVVQLFMNGGASQCDTFDYKPELIKRSGEKFDTGQKVESATSAPGNLMKSPYEWKQHGQCGRWVSSALPEIATCVDDLAFIMS